VADDRSMVVGVGMTPLYRRGAAGDQTELELAGKAVLAALDDAGLSIGDVDGFAFYRGGLDTGLFAQVLGVPEVRFSATVTGAGGGSAGAVGLADLAVRSGQASVVVSVMAFRQYTPFGAAFAEGGVKNGPLSAASTPEDDFYRPAGLVGPPQMFALLAQRHMHRYGTTRDHFAEVALSARANALTQPGSIMTTPLTRADYDAAPMISDPLCLYDCCLQTEGAAAIGIPSPERAADCAPPPVRISASLHGGEGRWGQGITWMNMDDRLFATSGMGSLARRLYDHAGVTAADIDVAMLYDHFSPMVLMQLEDYGFCPVGESGPYVASGAIRIDGASPVNPNGGQLSNGYLIGATLTHEAVLQLRGQAANQLDQPRLALVSGGPAAMPISGTILEVP
jgi:acetyl-CoA acetyltransferase